MKIADPGALCRVIFPTKRAKHMEKTPNSKQWCPIIIDTVRNTDMTCFGPIGAERHLEVSAYGPGVNLAKAQRKYRDKYRG